MAKHPELTGDFLHVPGYVQATDPGAVGAGKMWIDTSAGPSNYVAKIRNPANTAWVAVSGGGVGATNFPGLTDTPASYAGAANYKVVVNGTATGLIFVPDAGGGSFLPLAGGIMTGNIQFQDASEGVDFNDGAGVYFNGIKFDPTAPEIVIGEEAPDVGGHPPIRANSVLFRIGEGAGSGAGFLEMWSEDGGGWITVMSAITDNPGDPFEVGHGDGAFNILGSEARPTYNGGDLALLSDAAYDPTLVPRMQAGSGYAHISFNNVINVDTYAPGAPGAAVRISPRDFIKFIRGGTTVLEYKLEMPFWNPAPLASAYNTDATAAYIDLTDMSLNGAGIHLCFVYVRDNVGNETYGECALQLTDHNALL